jgi:hypothetical protein
MWNLLREGGWFAMLSAFTGGVATLLSLGALGALVKSRKIAWAVALGALVLTFACVAFGLWGTSSGRAATDLALAAVSPDQVEAIRLAGYRESQASSKVAALFALVPIVLGGLAALLGGRPKASSSTAFASSVPAGVSIAVLALTILGAVACGVVSILPP